MYGIGILNRDVVEGEVLMVGFDGVEDPETDDTGASEMLALRDGPALALSYMRIT